MKVEGDATIEQTSKGGKLIAKKDAVVGSEIKVWAEAGKKKSNVLKITVVDLAPSEVKLNLVSDKIKVGGGSISFNVGLTPTYATIRDYEVKITKINGVAPTEANQNWARIEEDAFVLGADAPIGTIFELTASIVGHSELAGTATVTVVETAPVDNITATDITINTVSDANKSAEITAFYRNKLVDTTLDMFSYSSDDENIAKVNADGTIEAKGHGEATITVTTAGSDATTTFKVYVIAPPTSIELQNVSSQIIQTSAFAYGKGDDLTLSLKGINANYACSNAYTYAFAMLDENGTPIGNIESADIATVGENDRITFKKTGKVQITIKSNSTLNKISTTEAQKVVVVNVNEGKNINTVADFKAYANQNSNITANILKDLYLTATENFGVYGDGQYYTLEFSGDRTINGNGYLISTKNLPLAISNVGGDDLLRFKCANVTTPFSVKIYDLSIIGCGNVEGKYSGNLDANKDSYVIDATGKYINTYRRGVRVYGASSGDVAGKETKAYAKDMEIKNVSVSGFDVGIRIEHAVDGVMSDINVANCFSNGMELNQNILTLNNFTLGQVGAFGIEMTPDDIADKKTSNPKGTAGENYDQTASLKLTGYIHSENYNNGTSTPYMAGLASKLNMSVPNLIDAIIGAMINSLTDSLGDAEKELTRQALTNVLNSCIKTQKPNKDGKLEDVLNFYLLIFIDGTEITSYKKGNTENKFANYTSNGESNMISIVDVLAKLAEVENYDGYKQYQYIKMDLETGTELGNIGQVILVNQAYDPNYTPKAQNNN